MKIRTCFVSNSSSESFIIDKKYLSEQQRFLIDNHIEYADRYEEIDRGFNLSKWDKWKIHEERNYLNFSTFMNNFDMMVFLEKIGVDITKVRNREINC